MKTNRDTDTTYRLTPHIVYHFETKAEKEEFLREVVEPKLNPAADLSHLSINELNMLHQQYLDCAEQAYDSDERFKYLTIANAFLAESLERSVKFRS